MKLLFVAALSCVALLGCRQSISGDLVATEEITFNKSNGSRMTLPAGRYDAKFQKETKKGELRLEIKVPNAKNVKAVFAAPNLSIPQEGEMTVAATESSQPWDLTAQMATDTVVGQTFYAREACNSNRPYWTCQWYAGGRHCNWWYDSYWYGVREVEYHYETTTRTVDVDLKDPVTGNVVATFDGDKEQHVEVVYDRIGACY